MHILNSRAGRHLMVGLLAVVALLPRALQGATTNATIGVYYFEGWYHDTPGVIAAFANQELRDDFPDREPIWGGGLWRGDTVAIMQQQIDLAADHGIAFFSFDWYWYGTQFATENDGINSGLYNFMQATNRTRMRFNINIVDAGPTTIDSDAEWEDVAEMLLPFLTDSQYLRVGGNPLVINFNAPGMTQANYDYFQQIAVTSGLSKVEFAANVAGSTSIYSHVTRYNAVLGYGGGEVEYPYQSQTEYIEGNGTWAPGIWITDSGGPQSYIPTVMSGWDPRPWGTPPSWYFNNPALGHTPAAFGAHLQKAIDWIDANVSLATPERLVMIYAWNEFGEGGYIAPTLGDPSGLYLDAIKSVVVDDFEPIMVITNMEMIPITRAGNAANTDSYGSVSYDYNIGKYEVTAGQYRDFLNAMAATDTYGLYNTQMTNPASASQPWTPGCQITRNGSPGSHTYDFSGRPSGTEAEWANRPVGHVTFYDACRFVNWLHNGKPTGAQDSTTTEDGAYFVNGIADTSVDGRLIVRKGGAKWFIPTEDEWYKAAWHKNDGVTSNYWTYATQSDTLPGRDVSETTNPGNNANYEAAGLLLGPPYYRTYPGSFEQSQSAYGTFGQAGNMLEWTEFQQPLGGGVTYRVYRGGDYRNPAANLLPSHRPLAGVTGNSEAGSLGFRVASPLIVTVPTSVAIKTVPVQNPGNAADTNSYGAVSYRYNIGEHEVTAGEYRVFLNAVAATDTHGCYDTRMDSVDSDTQTGCQITRNGSSGGYTYDFSGRPSGAEGDWANRPVNYISYWNALRFCNWLHNGQPTSGVQNAGTTEDGAYFINGYTGADGRTILRKPGATWWVPSEDEWYKAAYHKNDGATSNYWFYATRSDSVPGRDEAEVTNPGNNGNYDGFSGGYLPPYYRTLVGEFQLSKSAYGTFDQVGNCIEWTEAFKVVGCCSTYRVVRGGGYAHNSNAVSSSFRPIDAGYLPDGAAGDYGFRVATRFINPRQGLIMRIR